MSKGNIAEEMPPIGNQPTKDDPFAYVGRLLAEARGELGLSIKDIAKITNIRFLYLDAIEKGDLRALPGRVYTIGFIKSYATALKLDGDELLRQANLQNTIPEFNISAIPTPLPDQDLPSGRILIVSGLLAISIIVAAYLWQRSPTLSIFEPHPPVVETAQIENQEPPKEISEAPASLIKTEAATPPVDAVEAQATPTAAPTPQTITLNQPAVIKSIYPLTIKAKTTSWVEIIDSENKKLLSKLLTAGETVSVPEQDGLTLSTGNAGGIEVSVNGKILPPLGPVGHLKKGIKLDESLLEALGGKR